MKDLSEQTHYEVLELAPSCAIEALSKAYAQAKERYGPGSLATYALAEPSEAEALLRRIEEAFAVLSDPDRRRDYDRSVGFAERPNGRAAAAEPAGSVAVVAIAATEAAETVAAETVAEIKPVVEPTPEQSQVEPKPELSQVEPKPELSQVEMKPPVEVQSPVEESPVTVLGPVVEPVVEARPTVEPEPPVEQAPSASPERSAPASETSAPTNSAAQASSPPPAPEIPPDPKPVRKTESELPVDSAVTGDALRRVREARGLSLKDVEARTKIGHWHLENIERERYADLPAQVYLRGFLMSFARELKLDPVRVAKSYLEQLKAKSQAKPE